MSAAASWLRALALVMGAAHAHNLMNAMIKRGFQMEEVLDRSALSEVDINVTRNLYRHTLSTALSTPKSANLCHDTVDTVDMSSLGPATLSKSCRRLEVTEKFCSYEVRWCVPDAAVGTCSN